MEKRNDKVNLQCRRARFNERVKVTSESEEFRVIYRTEVFARSLELALGLLFIAVRGKGSSLVSCINNAISQG
jgi:hypothetical protein